MSVWLDHVKATRKNCPGMSFKEVLKVAAKTYNKQTKKAGPVTCKKPSLKKKSRKVRKTRKSRKGKSRKSRGKGKGKSRSRKTRKVPNKFKCKLYPNAPNC